tara:strand:+ start:3501 stop:4175 length:675 start_codon:yes stop_codon:yes gene_type:complete
MKYKYFYSKNIHKFTLILLHGMNMNITTLYKTIRRLQYYNKNLKIILPIADKMNINWPDGIEYNISSWYNYYTRYDNLFKHDNININDFEKQTNNIYHLLDKEISILENPKHIIIAGISQGGTLAFNVGINYKYKLAGIISIHSIFMNNVILFKDNYNKIPVLLFSGSKDNIYNIKFQNKCLNYLREKKFKIFWEIENQLGHCKYSKNEFKFLNISINYLFKNC